jgi:glucokinase
VLAAGIEFGGTKLLGVVIDHDGNVVAEAREPTPYAADELVDAIVALADELRPFDTIGIGAAGLVNRQGELVYAPNVGNITQLPLAARLEEALGHAVPVVNDAACAAVAEVRYGVARGLQEVAVVTLGTGIGGSFIVNGQMHQGANGFSGEPGHMIVNPDGPVCVCGQRGCWERYASGAGFHYLTSLHVERGDAPHLLAEAHGDPAKVTGKMVDAAARAGDAGALAIYADFARWLAVGIVNLSNLIDPEAVVLGGGMIAQADLFLETTRRMVGEMRYANNVRPPLRVEIATLGPRAGAIGAAIVGASQLSTKESNASR